jgi:hypothetical protein
MDFTYGGFTMSHAVGAPKPWRKPFVLSGLHGNPPSLADKAYWSNVQSPIQLYTNKEIRIKTIAIRITSFIGRFYKRT